MDHMYAFSSKSGSEPFRALGDLTWNDPEQINHILAKHTSKFCIYQHIPTDACIMRPQAIHSTLPS